MDLLALITDPLFRLPLATGLLAALLLPLLGTLLRLREEWLAALGLAHIAAAAGLVGLALGAPLLAGTSAGAVAAAGLKSGARARGNTAYALMILLGWCATLLAAANTHLGEALAHAMVDGQLYFAGAAQLAAFAGLALATLALWPWLQRRLLRARFFPALERANALPAWRWHLGFDVLVALAMALGTATVGLMAAFALAFVPPWIAFARAGSWRGALLWSVGVGLGAYAVAFVVALGADQPFGPVMVAALLAATPLRWRPRHRAGHD